MGLYEMLPKTEEVQKIVVLDDDKNDSLIEQVKANKHIYAMVTCQDGWVLLCKYEEVYIPEMSKDLAAEDIPHD